MRFAALVLTAVCVLGQPSKPILEHSFESGEDGWMAMGNRAHVHSVAGGASASSKSSLAFGYFVEPMQMALAVVPIQHSLAGVRSVRFWLKTDHATPVAVLLSESKPGGDYTAVVWSPKDTWQEVELRVEDFTLNDGPNDAKDDNGKLDLDKIQGFGVMDLSFFALGIDGAIPIKTSKIAGEHTLWLDDVRMAGGGASATPASSTIDNLERKNLQWLALGGATLHIAAESPMRSRAVRANYNQLSDSFVLFLRRIGHMNLSYSAGITIELASEKPAHLILSLEEKVAEIAKPVRFNVTIDLPGGREVVRKQLPFKEFELADDAPSDAPSRIDPAYLRTLSLVDLRGLVGGAAGANTLWISGLAGYK
ncbi:MAG: hypothetical protein HY820_25850 [Acidobacteria bacterium]|nr:hypothetical protein [Acidobacteriota bacterium]